MRLFGILLISFASGVAIYERCGKIRRQKEEYSAVLSLLVYFKGGILAQRRTPAELFCGFRQRKEASAIPWLSSLFESFDEDTERTRHFAALSERISFFMRGKGILTLESTLSGDDKERLAAFFSDLGMHSAEGEIGRLEGEIAHFTAREKEITESCEKSVKASWLLYAAAVTGIVIIAL